MEIASRPEYVRVEERLRRLIGRLTQALSGRLAIVSGRPADQIHALFGNAALAVAGSHGIEMLWPDGRVTRPAAAAFDASVLVPLRRLEAAHPRVIIEMKPHGIAVHYRLAPDAEQDCAAVCRRIAQEAGLSVQTGKKVIERKRPANYAVWSF